MKAFNKICAQGEAMFIKGDFQIPEGAQKIAAENGKCIIAHSESGHNHIMDGSCATLYKLPDSILECLLVVDKETTLEHLRPHDTHESILFQPGTYKVRYGREYTPQGWRRSED